MVQNAIVGMTSSTGSVSTAGTLNVDAQGELDIFATSGFTVGAGGNVDVIGSGFVNIDSSTVNVNAGTVYIGAQVRKRKKRKKRKKKRKNKLTN